MLLPSCNETSRSSEKVRSPVEKTRSPNPNPLADPEFFLIPDAAKVSRVQAGQRCGLREVLCPIPLGFGKLGREFEGSRDCPVLDCRDVYKVLAIDRFVSTEDKLSQAGVGRVDC